MQDVAGPSGMGQHGPPGGQEPESIADAAALSDDSCDEVGEWVLVLELC